MRPAMRLAALAATAAVAACSATSPSAPNGGSSATPPTPVRTSATIPTVAPDATTYWLRARRTQALPPLNIFGATDPLVITGDGVAVSPAPPVPTVPPGPLVISLSGRQVSDAGRARIMARAQELGLLGRQTDFGSSGLPGGVTGVIELTVDGQRVSIRGNPDAGSQCSTAPCSPAPGSPEAFGTFWREMLDLSWLGSDVGPASPFAPPVYSVLVGAPPQPDANLGASIAVWPLAVPITGYGRPVANGTARCGTSTGADAATLGSAFAKANALTQWVQSPTTNATFGLTVRPLVPGVDACREVFGVG